MKTLIVLTLMLTSVICVASDWEQEQKREKEEATIFISKLPEYSCFTQVYDVKAELPWELGGLRTDGVNMVIRKASSGYLMAQKIPECEKHAVCGYWIRSWTYSSNVFTHNLARIPCPKNLTKKYVLGLIKNEYKDEFRIDN